MKHGSQTHENDRPPPPAHCMTMWGKAEEVSPSLPPATTTRLLSSSSSHHVNTSRPLPLPAILPLTTSESATHVPASQTSNDVITSSSSLTLTSSAGNGVTQSIPAPDSPSIRSRSSGTSAAKLMDPNLMVRDEGWFRCDDPANKECQMTLGSSFIDPVTGQYHRARRFILFRPYFLLPVPHSNPIPSFTSDFRFQVYDSLLLQDADSSRWKGIPYSVLRESLSEHFMVRYRQRMAMPLQFLYSICTATIVAIPEFSEPRHIAEEEREAGKRGLCNLSQPLTIAFYPSFTILIRETGQTVLSFQCPSDMSEEHVMFLGAIPCSQSQRTIV